MTAWSSHESLVQVAHIVSPDAQVSSGSCTKPARQSFSIVGVPRTLHSDNDREFENYIVHTVTNEWPGDVVIVNARPRNPKCQGLVKQGDHMVEKLLGAHSYEYEGKDNPPWTCWISQIQ